MHTTYRYITTQGLSPLQHSQKVYKIWESDEEDLYKAQEGIQFDGESDEDVRGEDEKEGSL